VFDQLFKGAFAGVTILGCTLITVPIATGGLNRSVVSVASRDAKVCLTFVSADDN
jgi:hypothetical protein